jgi:predicted lipid-binding transport protein (Tim44 family)
MTQPPAPSYGAPAAPAYGGAPAFGRPAFGGGGFMSGLMGGLIGAGIGGMLFGHGMFGGIGGFSSIIGLLIQIALVVFVVRWLFRRFAGPSTAVPFVAGVGRMPQAMPTGMTTPGGGSGNPGPALSQGDFAAFEQSLQAIQAAWSTQDLNALRRLVTPEMLSYFSDQLAEQASRGVRNQVSDVRLLKGDLSEGWVENGKQYATVAMKFSMVDVTRDGAGHIVDGSLTEHVTATEFWTFMRVSGGNWVLSAIQQGR